MTSILVWFFVLGTAIYSIGYTKQKLSGPNFDSKEFRPLVVVFIVIAAFLFDVVFFTTFNVPNAGWFIAIAGIVSLFVIGFLIRRMKAKNESFPTKQPIKPEFILGAVSFLQQHFADLKANLNTCDLTRSRSRSCVQGSSSRKPLGTFLLESSYR
jgi:peptidoglycan/LPS O-acetylase OafA/YrhL